MRKFPTFGILLFLAASVALVAQCASHSPQVMKESPNYENADVLKPLLKWLDEVSNNNAIVMWGDGRFPSRFFRDVSNQHLEMRTNSEGHRGIFVTSPTSATASQVMVAVPTKSLMSPASARDSTRSEPLASLLNKTGSIATSESTAPLEPLAILVAHLMCELSKHDKSPAGSFWGPYLNTLPLGADVAADSPLNWSDEVLNESPSLMEHVQVLRKRRVDIRSTVEFEVGLGAQMPGGCSGSGWRRGQSFEEAFDEAYFLAMSRKASSLPLELAAGGEGTRGAKEANGTTADVTYEVMTPLLDLLNHRREGGGRYTLLYASEGDVLGVGMLAPTGAGLQAGDEVWHDYEAGWSSEATDSAGICDYEILANYGFVPDTGTESSANGACALLPWVGVVRLSDASDSFRGGRVLDLCRGKTPVVSNNGAQLSDALQWEIEHDLAAVEAILESSTPGGDSGEDEEQERGECVANIEMCTLAKAATQRMQSRRKLVKQIAEGEATVLRALHDSCSTKQTNQNDLQGRDPASTAAKTRKKSSTKKKRQKKTKRVN